MVIEKMSIHEQYMRFDGFRRNTRGHGALGRGNCEMDFLYSNLKYEKADTQMARAASAGGK